MFETGTRRCLRINGIGLGTQLAIRTLCRGVEQVFRRRLLQGIAYLHLQIRSHPLDHSRFRAMWHAANRVRLVCSWYETVEHGVVGPQGGE